MVSLRSTHPTRAIEVTVSTEEIQSLNQLEERVATIEEAACSNKPHKYAYVSPLLFRGHARASWKLETTLERFGKKNLRLDDYVRYLSKVKPGVEAYTDRTFTFAGSNPEDASRTFPLSEVSLLNGQYEFMVYLRHHGFPTPLLDWSRSLYVALYFACSGPNDDEPSALHMFIEHLGYAKSGWVGAPEIVTLGQYVSAHKRHFTQQSEYTACIAKIDDRWCFHPHGEAMGTSTDRHNRLIKVLIPTKLRSQLLRKLDTMNINAFSLFGTDEALMETLAFREISD